MIHANYATLSAALLIIAMTVIHADARENAEYTGLVKSKSGNTVTIQMDGQAPLVAGASFDVYTFFTKQIFGMNTTGWLHAAEATLVSLQDGRAVIRITAEKSTVTVNDKKVEHIKQGVRVKLVPN